MPRDVSLSDSKCWNGGQKWVKRSNLSPRVLFSAQYFRSRFFFFRQEKKNSPREIIDVGKATYFDHGQRNPSELMLSYFSRGSQSQRQDCTT